MTDTDTQGGTPDTAMAVMDTHDLSLRVSGAGIGDTLVALLRGGPLADEADEVLAGLGWKRTGPWANAPASGVLIPERHAVAPLARAERPAEDPDTPAPAPVPAKRRTPAKAAAKPRTEADVRADIAAANDDLLAADWKLSKLGDELLTFAKYDDAALETLRVEHERALQAAWRAHLALIAHLRAEYRAARDTRRGGMAKGEAKPFPAEMAPEPMTVTGADGSGIGPRRVR